MPIPTPLAPPEGFVHLGSSVLPSPEDNVGLALSDGARALAYVTTAGAPGDYLARLLAMNEQMNLTAIREPAEAWERHVLDALALVPLLAELGPRARLVDVGSGGGLPGIPLAIALPSLRVTLVEATQKKAAFLVAAAAALELANVSVRAERAEQLVTGELRGAFDAVTARAVGRLATLVPLTAPFVRRGGLVLLVKGQRADEELAEARGVLAKQRSLHEKTVATPTGRIVVLRRR